MICHGKRGQIQQAYRDGQEDQLGCLGLGLKCVVWWNTPLDRINFNGRSPITRPDLSSGVRPLREPTAGEEDS